MPVTAAGPASARSVSGRRLVVIAAAVCIILSAAAGLTSRSLWLTLGGARPVPARLDGAVVWPDHARRAPALGLPDQNGRVFTVPGHAGKVVVVAFWDPACPGGCQQQAHTLATVRSELAATAPVELVVMSTGPAPASPASARAFAARAGWDIWVWHWLFASPRRLAAARRAYGLPPSAGAARAPVLFLVGRDGYERAGLRFPLSGRELATDLRRLQLQSP